MSKYIDAEDITSTIRKVRTKFAIDSVFGENLREDAAAAGALEAVAQVIDILPAADVTEVVKEWCDKRNCIIVAREDFPRLQEVRHGEWVFKFYCGNMSGYDYGMNCSVCGKPTHRQFAEKMPPFCPNCGASMRGEEDE